MPIEAKDIFEATSKSLRELLSENGLGLYIPPYQRPYGWDKSKVERLLDDTFHGLTMVLDSEDSFTFLGTIITIHDINYLTVQPIVRDEVPAKVLTVIDGQQRLSTLLILTVALQNQIRLKHRQVFKGVADPDSDEALSWLDGQVLSLIKSLSSMIYERQASGTSPIYPRIIRAFDDQWSKKQAQARYDSPVANLISAYAELVESNDNSDFKPVARDVAAEGERELVRRYGELSTALKTVSKGKQYQDLEGIPSLKQIADSQTFQKALLNHEFPAEVVAMLKSKDLAANTSELCTCW